MSSKSKLSKVTELLHTKVDCRDASAVVTPLFQNSAFRSDSPYFYTRKSNPNSSELELAIANLAGAEHCLSVTTGMSAISVVLSLLKPGDKIAVNSLVYGCSFKLFQRFSDRLNLELHVANLSVPEQLDALPADLKMVFFETPTNPYLQSVDISKVASVVKEKSPDAKIVVDNTWATPLFQKPLQLGAHISLHSATKYFSGHSDVMGGLILVDDQELYDRLFEERFYTGSILDPHSAWLLRRSLQTFPLRMKEHERVTKEMVTFLKDIPEVEKIYYPEVDGNQLEGYGGILFFSLAEECKDKYPQFMKALELFDSGTGMACVTSMVAQPYSGSHASMSEEEKQEMGLDESLVRLCFGFEDAEDLKRDLKRAFQSLGNSNS